MANFPHKSELLEQVHLAGRNYLDSVRESAETSRPLESDYHDFNTLTLNESSRKRGNFVVTRMVSVPVNDSLKRLMDEPIFRWNESIQDPIVVNANNNLINSSDCFPPSLSVLAMDYADQGYGYGDTIYDKLVKKVGALFFNNATIRDFQIDAMNNRVGLHFPDPGTSPPAEHGHVASGNLLYSIMQNGNLPAFDIHDVTHHASQMTQYGEFYQWLTQRATHEVMSLPEKRLEKRIIRSALLTTLEHSVVASKSGIQSFGCLNWQAPHKSHLSTGVTKRSEYRINDYPFGAQDINLWSGIRAIASIYREQLEVQQLSSEPINLMHELGYSIDKELLERIQPKTSYDYSDLPFDVARRTTIVVPESPEQLFQNTKVFIERYVDD